LGFQRVPLNLVEFLAGAGRHLDGGHIMKWRYALPFSVCAALVAAAILGSGEEVPEATAVVLWAGAGTFGFVNGVVVALTSRRAAPRTRGPLAARAAAPAAPLPAPAAVAAPAPELQPAT
jgi:hypothetical protein